MWRKRAVYLAPWLWWALVVFAVLVALGLAWRNRTLVHPGETALGLVSVLAYATPGALIVARRHGNRIGWLFLLVATLLAASMLSAQYALFALRTAGQPTRLAFAAAWLQTWISAPAFLIVSLFIVLYPDGRLSSRRWLLPLAAAALSWGFLITADMFQPGSLVLYPMFGGEEVFLLRQNPFGRPMSPATAIGDESWFAGLVSFIISMTAPLFRYRHAGARTRQQLRWLMFLALTVVAGFLVAFTLEEADVALPWFFEPVVVAMLGFPLAVSVAILRHNLFDLDVVINRTLVYGALTAMLALVYFSSVVTLQLFLPQRTALSTVLSTLAVAALFNPLRARLQAWIDRRFYRRKYDAARALADFAAQARDEVDLHKLLRALIETVEDTVQPRTVWLWLHTDK